MKTKLLLISLGLFLLLLPLSLQVKYPQNDDWAFRQCLESFLNGDFSQNPLKLFGKSAPLFYVQGIISIPFAAIFGLENISAFTLLISVINFYLVVYIINTLMIKTFWQSVLFGLLFFFNPLYIYLSLGYMTDNYFVLFFLFSLLFILKGNFYKANLFIVLGFFIKQFSIILSLTYAIHLYLHKSKIKSMLQILITLFLYFIYKYIFLRGINLYDEGYNLNNVLDLKYATTVIIAVLVSISAYTLPLLISQINKNNFLPIFLSTVFTLTLIRMSFSPTTLYSAEFPYFGNTVDKTGFLVRSIAGIKTHFVGMHDLYIAWELMSKLFVGVILYIILKSIINRVKSFPLLFLLIFIPFLIVNIQVYDRYLILILLCSILYLSYKPLTNLGSIITLVFVLFLGFLSYQFSLDFVIRENYVWERASSLYTGKDTVDAGIAWQKINGKSNTKYIFSHSKEKEYKLIEEKEVIYPFRFFVEDKIYLYEM